MSDVARKRALRAALGVGLATAAYGVSFGALSVASGLDIAQTVFLSLVMFTGGSQFALIGVLAAGGTAAGGSAIWSSTRSTGSSARPATNRGRSIGRNPNDV